MDPEVSRTILAPATEFDRTEALESLLDDVERDADQDLGELADFLVTYVTADFKQAALVGAILARSGASADGTAQFARMFPALTLHQESHLRRAVVELMPSDMTPLQLYDAILDSTFSSDPTSADYHYAYQVLAYVDPDSVRESWADYL